MKPRAATLTAVSVVALALLAGCGGGRGGDGSPGPSGQPIADAGAVLVDVRTGVGGFTPVEVAIENRPLFRLYGDGVVVVRGPEEGPLPLPWTYRLSQAGIDVVLAAARRAGLLADPPDYGLPPVTDVGSTTVTFDVAGMAVVHEAYALGYEDGPEDGLTPSQRDARAALQGFVELVGGLADERPGLIVADPRPYDPRAIDVHVWRAPDDSGVPSLDWPLGRPPEELPSEPGASSRCATVSGAELEALERALAGAEAPVSWRSGDALWSSGFHVVLPGEQSCEDTAGGLPSGYLLPPEAWTNLEPAAGDVFRATTEGDAAAAESAIAAYLAASADSREAEVRDRLAGYTRQYVGLERDGRRLVYVNAFCDDAGLDPANDVVWVMDGGTCFWQALADPATGELVDLRINGEA